MEQLIYNNEVVKGHSLYSSCSSTLNDVSNDDYHNSNYFDPDIECLDVDYYEQKILQHQQPNPTVDAVIGIQTYNNNSATNDRLLIIELRIDYKTTSTLSKTEMEQKVNYTKILLGRDIDINSKSFFIFNESLAPQAKRWFSVRQREGGEFKNCESFSINEFNNLIKSSTVLPYVPKYPQEQILKDLNKHISVNSEYIKQIDFWCEIARSYQYKNPYEFNHIKDIIKDEWRKFKNNITWIDEEEEFSADILEEKFSFII